MGGSRGNGCVQRWRGVHVPHEGGQVAEYAVGLCRRHAQAEQVFHAHRLQHLPFIEGGGGTDQESISGGI